MMLTENDGKKYFDFNQQSKSKQVLSSYDLAKKIIMKATQKGGNLLQLSPTQIKVERIKH
jgi:hypothetical protein